MQTYLGALIAMLVLVHLAFLVALKIRRNDLADVLWGPGFLVVAAGAYFARKLSFPDEQLGLLPLLVLACAGIWALRLFLHLGLRTFLKKDEDIRYKNWRAEWGASWKWRTYLQVFLLQGGFMLVIAWPLVHAIDKNVTELNLWSFIGGGIWLGGFLFEAISDAQLKKFKSKAQNKGQLMTQGLWSWSRHPNYFGEVLQWWGIFFIVVTASTLGTDFVGWLTVLSPLTISFLILKVSGVPMLEELMKSRPGFAEYKKTTSIFIPRPPFK